MEAIKNFLSVRIERVKDDWNLGSTGKRIAMVVLSVILVALIIALCVYVTWTIQAISAKNAKETALQIINSAMFLL